MSAGRLASPVAMALLAACVIAAGFGGAGGMAGCAGDRAGAGEPGAALRGWAVALRVVEPERNLYARYDVSRIGVMTYTAGRDDKVVWTGTPTDDELRAIADLLEANREPERAPTPGRGESGREYRLAMHAPGAWGPTTIDSGATPFLKELEALLQRIQVAHRPEVFEKAGEK